jgi:hypothetical protein
MGQGDPLGQHQAGLEHDPEQWKPVFGKDHAQTKSLSDDGTCENSNAGGLA